MALEISLPSGSLILTRLKNRRVKKGLLVDFPAFWGCLLELSSEMSPDLIEMDEPN